MEQQDENIDAAKREMVGQLRETVNVLHLIRKENTLLTEHERGALQYAISTLRVILNAHIDSLPETPEPKLEVAKRLPVNVPVVSSLRWRK